MTFDTFHLSLSTVLDLFMTDTAEFQKVTNDLLNIIKMDVSNSFKEPNNVSSYKLILTRKDYPLWEVYYYVYCVNV